MSRLLSFTEAKEALLDGGLVGVPTETVYGLAANAFDEEAVARIFSVKKRPRFNPMICHLARTEDLHKYAKIEAPHRSLFSLWPGPLTLLLERRENIPDIVCAGLDYAAFRIPAHPLFRELIALCKVPLAAPSANIAGQRSPTTAAMVLESEALASSINGVLDGGPCEIGLESTIVRLKKEKKMELEILRPGGLSYERLCEAGFSLCSMEEEEEQARGQQKSQKPLAPGNLSQHYAPSLPLLLILAEKWERSEILNGAFAKYKADFETSCYLAFGREKIAKQFKHCLNLSYSARTEEAAQNFFYFFDQAKKLAGLKLLIAHLLPEQSLGRAVNDRLRRAASLEIEP